MVRACGGADPAARLESDSLPAGAPSRGARLSFARAARIADGHDVNERRRPNPVLRLARWTLIVAGAVLIPSCAAWVLSAHLYLLDMIAAFSAQISLAAFGVGAALLAVRPRVLGGVTVAAAALAMVPVVSGRALTVSDRQSVREVVVVVFNMYPRNRSWGTDLRVMGARDPDVLVIPEIPTDMNRAIRWHGFLDGTTYEHWRYRFDTPGFILSKHPITRIDPEDPRTPIAPDEHGKTDLTCIVHHPDGDFVVSLVHPLSPRGAARWREGTERLGRRLAALEGLRLGSDMPVILGADLNASYAQHRARLVRDAGFTPAKPLWPIRGGTFPVGTPGVFRPAIDDVWVSPGVGVRSWSLLPSVGSDHMGVITRLGLPE